MAKLSIRDRILSKRADEQLPLPFGPQEERAAAMKMARAYPLGYFEAGHAKNPNFDDITEWLLENASRHTYRAWIFGGYLDDSKFHNYNLRYFQSELLDDPVEFLINDWHKMKQVTPDTSARKQIIDTALEAVLEDDISGFFRAADQWDMPVSQELMDKGRELAIEIAERDPESYFEKYWLMHIEDLNYVTEGAASKLAAEYPKKYLEMLNGNFWDDFQHRTHAFDVMARNLAADDPNMFFEDLYDNRDEYKDNGLLIPADAIIEAGEWLAENYPAQYVELGLNDVPELNEVTRKLGLAGATLPKALSDLGYGFSVDTGESNFMSIYSSNYPDQQRHPEAAKLDRFDIAINWPSDDPARKVQKVITDDYDSHLHDVGNPSSTKSFALVAPDIENSALLVEQIQSDFPAVLYRIKEDRHFARAEREGIKEEEYNDFTKRMSEHMAAYPYLMIQRIAEFADQNENIDKVKLSSLPSILSFAGITNKKKAKRVYEDVPKELGFAVPDEYIPSLSIDKFINHESRPMVDDSITSFTYWAAHDPPEKLRDMFEMGDNYYSPGSEQALKVAAKRLAKQYPDWYIDLGLHEIKEFLPYTLSLDSDTYRFFNTWSTYDGDMKKLAQRAAKGAEQAVEKLYEGLVKKPKPVSKREKKVRKLDISSLKPAIEKIIGDRANQIEFSEDIGAFMRSVGKLQRDKLITLKEKNQITGLISKYVRAFLDVLITKVANMYGVKTSLSVRAAIDDLPISKLAAIEGDIIKKYPHLEEYIVNVSDRIEPKYLKWFSSELNKYDDYKYTSAKLLDYIQEFKSNRELLDSNDLYSYTLESLVDSVSDIKALRGQASKLAKKYFAMLKEKRDSYSNLPRDEARSKAYKESRLWIKQIQPDSLQKMVRKQISSTIKQREVSRGSESQAIRSSDVIFEDDRFLVVLPGTTQASKYFGSGTQWCTAAEKSNMFSSYSEKDVYLYYIIDKQNADNDNAKIAFAVTKRDGNYISEEIFNKLDQTIGMSGLKKYLGKYHDTILSAINNDIEKRDTNKYKELIAYMSPDELADNIPPVISNNYNEHVSYVKHIIESNQNVKTVELAKNKLKKIAEQFVAEGDRRFFSYKLDKLYPELTRLIAEKFVADINPDFFLQSLHKPYPELGRDIAEKFVAKRYYKAFFYYLLHKSYPDLARSIAEIFVAEGQGRKIFEYRLDKLYPDLTRLVAERWSSNMDNRFFHHGLDGLYPELTRPWAEAYSAEGNHRFFYLGLHHFYPELGRPIAEKLMSDANGHSRVVQYRLDRLYPDIYQKYFTTSEAAGLCNKRVISKIQIRNGDNKNTISLSKRANANMISIRAKVTSDSPAYTKKEKSESGNDVYVYTEKHIEKRWKEKKDKLKKLEKELDKVRKQYREDLKSDDERTRAIAAIVGIMDDTAMRIGNEESAREGTYGASTLKVKHVKGGKGKMTFDFPGKGSVEQNVALENNEVIKTIRDLMKGKKADDFIFEVDGKKIWDRAVNRYLKPMGISAKDLRGFHANRLMKEMLKKKDFKDALNEVADIVGHKPSTLKNQYLDPELVEKHEEKEKKASISIRADELNHSTFDDSKVGPSVLPHPKDITQEQKPTEVDIATLVNLNKNVGNVEGDIANYPELQRAWQILAPFLPENAKLTSGWRGDNEQAKIIIDYWLSAIWVGRRKKEIWKRDQGFFYTNFPGPKANVLRWWRDKTVSGIPISGRMYRRLKRDIEPLRKVMTSYVPAGVKHEPPTALSIAALGTSKHMQGLAFDVGGAPLKTIERAASYINKNVAPIFVRILPEKGQNVVHVVIRPDVTLDNKALANALLEYQSLYAKRASISKRALEPDIERYVSQLEGKYFGAATKPAPRPIAQKRPANEIKNLKKNLGIEPGVRLNDIIINAWATLRPFLPEGAKMTSGARTYQDQVRIINNYWNKSGLQKRYPNVEDPYERSKLLIQNRWIVGPPTTKKKNVHLTGRAFDVSGADLNEIAAAAHRVSQDPNIPVTFSQVLIEPRNNAVHIGISDAVWNPSAVESTLSRAAGRDVFISKVAEDKWRDESEVQVSSIYEDLAASNPPEDVLEDFNNLMKEDVVDDDADKVESSLSRRDISISSRAFESYEEFKREMGIGLEDEPGDWFEKSPIFRHREEGDIPEYNATSANESEASELASKNPDKFFYRGLHKEFPKLEAKALENFIKENAAFYFNFKYHEREESEFKKLLEPATEALAQQDVRAFFYYHLHHNFPELGRGAIIQLIDTNPDSFFDLGLQKDYPDYHEAAGHARNIKDPNKVELEMPEWINSDVDKPMSLRDRNAAQILPAHYMSGLGSSVKVSTGDFRNPLSRRAAEELRIYQDPAAVGKYLKKVLRYIDENLKTVRDTNQLKWLQRKRYETLMEIKEKENKEPTFEWIDYGIKVQELQKNLQEAEERLVALKDNTLSDTERNEILLNAEDSLMSPEQYLQYDINEIEEQIEGYQKTPEEAAEWEKHYEKHGPYSDIAARNEATPPNPEAEDARWTPQGEVQYYEDVYEETPKPMALEQESLKLSYRQSPLSKRAVTRKLTVFPEKPNGDQEETQPGMVKFPSMEEMQRMQKEREEQLEKMLAEEPDYSQRPMDLSFDQEVDIRDMKPFDVVRYFLFKHYKRDKYIPYNKEILPKLFVVQPSKFFDLELFNDPEFVDDTRRAVFHVAILEPEYFKRFVEPNFPELSEGYRSLADKSMADGRDDAQRRSELLKKKLSMRDMALSKRAGKLDYPKKMLEDIVAWAEEVTPKFKWKLYGEPAKKLTKAFPIDITDTEQYEKHLWLPEARKLITDADWDTELEVTLYRSDPYEGADRKTGGTYGHEEGRHEIWVFDTLNELKSGELEDTLKHELTHMMQTVMTTLVQTAEKGKFEGIAGMPTHKAPEHEISHRTEGLSDKEQIIRQYQRQDIEFAPFLQEAISRMQNYVGRVPSEEKRDRFLEFISRDEFVTGLKDYDTTRYNKALKELYRALEGMHSISHRTKPNLSKRCGELL